jgi:uncharacterized membrane protein
MTEFQLWISVVMAWLWVIACVGSLITGDYTSLGVVTPGVLVVIGYFMGKHMMQPVKVEPVDKQERELHRWQEKYAKGEISLGMLEATIEAVMKSEGNYGRP